MVEFQPLARPDEEKTTSDADADADALAPPPHAIATDGRVTWHIRPADRRIRGA